MARRLWSKESDLCETGGLRDPLPQVALAPAEAEGRQEGLVTVHDICLRPGWALI